MCSEHGFIQCIPQHELSDETVVEILDFLHLFMTDFENRYFAQIHRYYDDRSQHHIIQTNPVMNDDDPPF
jgi:hypothetical protein